MALKGYKVPPAKAPKATKVEKDYVQDMALAQEQAELKAQAKKYKAYLEQKVETTPEAYVKFFRDMLKLVSDGVKLTPNMEAALDRCMERDKAREEQKKNPAEQAERKIVLKIKAWLMKDMGIHSRVITGVVKAETARAYLIQGHADMLENARWCMRCGQELTEPASQVTGFGPICAAKLGVPYDTQGVLTASKEARALIRRQYAKVLRDQAFERWIPKSQVEEVLPEDTKLETDAPKAKGRKSGSKRKSGTQK